MASYRTIHEYRIPKQRGKAATHVCPCGNVAEHWAYRYGSALEEVDGQGRVFSQDPNDYDALCRKCHVARDRVQERIMADPITSEKMREAGRKGGAAVSRIKVTCGCGREMSPGALATHQKYSGHKEIAA